MGSRFRANTYGRYYISDECNGCGLCESYSRENFTSSHDGRYYVVAQQPLDESEEHAVIEAMENCPLGCIHDDGDSV